MPFPTIFRKSYSRISSEVSARDDVSCVGIPGTREAFCAGGDIASMIELQGNNDSSVIESRISV
jgi:enoyl-CoA hydratase/carnithine racemase